MFGFMKNETNRWLLTACGLLTLSATPLWAIAQSSIPSAAPAATSAPAAVPAPAPALPSPDEAGYIIGLGVGQQLRQYGVTNQVTLDKIVEGVRAGLAGQKAVPADQQRVHALLISVVEAAAAKNAADAKAFLERNGKEKGVKTTASGLQYKIIQAGNAKAASPQPTDQVTVQYRGTFMDGTEFDSSYKRGSPTTLGVNGVIKGWQEALVLMKPGAKWQLFVPPELGYGQAARPGIPGGSLLIFEVELQSIKSPPAPAKAADPTPAASPAPAKP